MIWCEIVFCMLSWHQHLLNSLSSSIHPTPPLHIMFCLAVLTRPDCLANLHHSSSVITLPDVFCLLKTRRFIAKLILKLNICLLILHYAPDSCLVTEYSYISLLFFGGGGLVWVFLFVDQQKYWSMFLVCICSAHLFWNKISLKIKYSWIQTLKSPHCSIFLHKQSGPGSPLGYFTCSFSVFIKDIDEDGIGIFLRKWIECNEILFKCLETTTDHLHPQCISVFEKHILMLLILAVHQALTAIPNLFPLLVT